MLRWTIYCGSPARFGAILASAYMSAASRFDQRIKALEYDYEILVHALDVLVKHEAHIEVQA